MRCVSLRGPLKPAPRAAHLGESGLDDAETVCALDAPHRKLFLSQTRRMVLREASSRHALSQAAGEARALASSSGVRSHETSVSVRARYTTEVNQPDSDTE
jgi:hypothetical protein